ncbi:MAG: hypothetical protein ACFE95_06695 [Candidatus Hodarchaeota archaeon]
MAFEQITSEKEKTLDQVSSSLRGNNLLVILSDEGGIPIYTRAIHIDKRTGEIKNRVDLDFTPNNENILLMTGLIEAIMQLKDIVRPTVLDITHKKQTKTPLYVDYARGSNGMALVSISTSPEFQQLPTAILDEYSSIFDDLENLEYDQIEANFEKAIVGPLNEDRAIYWKILSQIKKDLTKFVSFISVFDEEGKYLFSTSKNEDQYKIPDPLFDAISKYVKNEYIMKRYRENPALIGAKRLSSSVIWHFKCYDRIFVFFTYMIPDMYDFSIIESEMITFISNNLEQFIKASRNHPDYPSKMKKEITSTRFIFLS